MSLDADDARLFERMADVLADTHNDQAVLLSRIADALEAIADPPDKSNAGIATKLKEAEELAEARLLQLQAVKSLISGVDAGEAVDRALTLLNSVLP